MRTIAITIEEDVLERVDRLLRKAGSGTANRSRFIRRAVRDCIDRLEQQAVEEHETAIVRRNRAKLARQARALIEGQAEP